MPLLSRLRHAAREKVAMDPSLAKMLLAGGAGALTAGVPTALIMKAHADEARNRARNVGFGAGVATGLAGPHIASGLQNVIQGLTQ
jgi:hypothetical protein